MTDTGYPTLPQGHQRFVVEQLLLDVAADIGLRSGALRALLHMITRTSPDDWTRPDREPVYFAAQDETAADLGITRRALYNTESRLEALGLIERRLKGNGQRSSYGGCGIVFSRLVARVPDFLALRDQLRAERKHRKALRNRRSTFLRYIKRRLPEDRNSAPAELTAIIDAFNAWPRADALARMPIDTLEVHVEDAKALCVALDQVLKNTDDSSHAPAENFSCLIQENNQDSSPVECNASVFERSAGKPAQSDSIASGPHGPADCLENKNEAEAEARKANMMRMLTPQRLFKLASPDMQALVTSSAEGAVDLSHIHFMDAAERSLSYLGINHSAWVAAIEAMGEQAATICVLLLDANRDHPTVPVRNAGGALRAMTKRHHAGTLNLVGSLIGLSRRRGV